MTRLFYIPFLFAVLLAGCHNSKELNAVLLEAEELIDNHPDSVLMLLDSLTWSGKPGLRMNPDYILLETRAKDKARQNIATDTLIFAARDYFEKQDDPVKAAQANVYCGRVYYYNKEYDKALESYLRAKDYASDTGDADLKGSIAMFIGEVYFKRALYEQAVASYKEALSYFTGAPELLGKAVYPYREIAKAFDLTRQPDSAFYYFDRGLEIAEHNADTAMIKVYKQNIATAYSKTGEYDKAVGLLKEVLTLNPNDRNLSHVYRSLADIFRQENKPDSALFYLDRSLEYADPGNHSLLANIYALYYDIEIQRSNYRSALEHYEHYIDHTSALIKENDRRELLAVEKKYQFERIQNELKQKTIEEQRVLLICGILLIGILIVSFLLYRKHISNKKLSDDFYRKIEELDALSKNIEADGNQYRKAFAEQFEILKKTATLEHLLNEEERLKGKKLIRIFNEIVYARKEGVDWEKLYATINGMSGGHLEIIHAKLPQLNETEFKICCLTYAGLNNTQISIILQLALDTIQAKKTGIRKKLGMARNENLKNYLEGLCV